MANFFADFFTKKEIWMCSLQIEFNIVFMGPSVVDFPRKYYINDFRVGITNATFKRYVIRGK